MEVGRDMKDPIMYICGATTASLFFVNRPIEAFAVLAVSIAISVMSWD